jgi:2-polyprenyl-3-methyl-5-hydroxy-6-metoxy-1,4-benzoquinol methylase
MINNKSAICPLCSRPVELYWPQSGFFRCNQCELLFRNSLPVRADYDSLYYKSWQKPEDNINETGSTNLYLSRQYAKFLSKALKRTDLKGLKILDFGAGTGSMAEAMEKSGAEIVAVEPFGYDYIERKGITVFHTLDEILAQQQIFDGVVSLEVVEHLPEPLKDLKTIYSILKPKGWLYVSTPNSHGLNARIMRDRWREALKVGHIALYNSKSLSKLLSLAGFQGERLKWWVKYQDSIIIQAKDYLLQQFWADGDLRMLTFRDR